MAAATPALKFADLKLRLTRGQPLAPVILLAGPEPYFKEEALGLVAAALERQAGGALNRVGVDAASAELEGLPATHFSPSLFGGEKLVVLRGFDKARAAERKSFLKTLGGCHFPPGIHLVILSEEMKSAPAELKGLDAMTVVFYVPWRSELLTWIGKQFTAMGVRCSQELAERLYQLHGKTVPWKADLEVDLFKLAGSIERLARHVQAGKGKTLELETVRQLLGGRAAPDVFGMAELLGQRSPKALAALRAFLADTGENPIGLVAILLERFEKLLRVRSAAATLPAAVWREILATARASSTAVRGDVKKAQQAELSGLLAGAGEVMAHNVADIKDYQRPTVVLQAGNYTEAELAGALCRLVELDRRLKSGAGDERTEVELFVAQLLRS